MLCCFVAPIDDDDDDDDDTTSPALIFVKFGFGIGESFMGFVAFFF